MNNNASLTSASCDSRNVDDANVKEAWPAISPQAQLGSQQQNLLAELCVALYLSPAEIVAATGLPIEYIHALQQSPLFLAEVQRIRSRFATQHVHDATTLLQSETLTSVYTLMNIRDDPAINVRERRLAAEGILDRVPETSKSHQVKHEHTANFTPTDAQFQALLLFINDDPIAKQAFDTAIQLSPQDYTQMHAANRKENTSDVIEPLTPQVYTEAHDVIKPLTPDSNLVRNTMWPAHLSEDGDGIISKEDSVTHPHLNATLASFLSITPEEK